jgi:DNA polymerase-3 subunit delta'
VVYRLGALPSEDLKSLLAERRPALKSSDRALVARLAEGAVGRALTLDLDGYLASRQDALILLRTTLREPDYSQLFHATESYRAGADGQEKTIRLLRALGSLFEDLLLIVAGTPQLIRNLDIEDELTRLARNSGLSAQGSGLDWIDNAARALSQVEQGMRRNLLRSLSLDAMAVGLGRD